MFEFFRSHLQGVPARHERGEGDHKFQKSVKNADHAALQHGSTGPVLRFQAKDMLHAYCRADAGDTIDVRFGSKPNMGSARVHCPLSANTGQLKARLSTFRRTRRHTSVGLSEHSS